MKELKEITYRDAYRTMLKPFHETESSSVFIIPNWACEEFTDMLNEKKVEHNLKLSVHDLWMQKCGEVEVFCDKNKRDTLKEELLDLLIQKKRNRGVFE